MISVALGLGAYGGMVATDAVEGTLRAGQTSLTIGLYLIAFSGFLLVIWWNERHRIPWRWLWIVPVVFRILMLFTTPTLSDDVYRYLWDGHVASEGVNPYEYTLDSPELDQYEIPARDLANNPSFGTPYLPTAQAVFATSAVVSPSEPISLQMAMVGFDLGAAVLIVQLLSVLALPRSRVLLYLWNPLVIIEVAHSAHLDAMMVALAMLAVVLTLVRSPWWMAPLALTLATLTRPVPILLLPVLWWPWTWRQRALYGASTLAILTPFALGAGWGLTGETSRTGVFGSARVFLQEVAFNGGVYNWFEHWSDRLGASDAAATARTVAAVALALVVADTWRRASKRRDPIDTMRLMAIPVTGYIFLSSILHPWYILLLVALLPFLAPAPGEGARAWWRVVPALYLSAALVLSYLTYRDPQAFGELQWVRRVEWYPAVVLLGVASRVGTARQHDPTAVHCVKGEH